MGRFSSTTTGANRVVVDMEVDVKRAADMEEGKVEVEAVMGRFSGATIRETKGRPIWRRM